VDSVIVACEVILKEGCDLVVSGINGGPNLGEDVLYSGTVGAAIEAMFFGYPAIAVSLNSRKNEHFNTAAMVITELISGCIIEIIQPETILSINVPAVRYEDLKGYKVTRTGRRRYVDFVVEQKDPRGRSIYWLGGENPKWIKEEGTDIVAITDNYVSITPISPKFTDESSFPVVQGWIDNLSDNSTGWYSGNEIR
jgi:5'-nucleotidase